MTLSAQAKLLRAIETGTFRRLGDTKEIKVNVRFVLATNRRLGRDMSKGKFRRDLFYRISTITLDLPPLRHRKEDLPLLVDHFLEKFTQGTKNKRFSGRAVERLAAHDWPGNIRELANTIERAVIISGDREELDIDDLPDTILGLAMPYEVLSLADAETRYIQKVLRLARGNKSRAAKLLGIGRKRLYDKLRTITETPYAENER
jgi:two-component system NtrC family response regulator